jgi:hypothetical protein
MAWTQTDVDALKTAVAGGVKSVSYSDKTVVYHTLTEMLQALQAMEAEVAAGSGETSAGRCTLAGTYSV